MSPMARPRCPRRLGRLPDARYFKPRGIPLRDLEEVVLGFDELEALRLADLEGLYQAEAARRMGVSRATFGRVVGDARRKVADALVRGLALRIEGGDWELGEDAIDPGPGRGRRRRRRGAGGPPWRDAPEGEEET